MRDLFTWEIPWCRDELSVRSYLKHFYFMAKRISSPKIFGLPHIHENTSIKFTNDGMSLSTGLNVSPDIAAFLTFYKSIYNFKGVVFKGEKMQIYKLCKKIPSSFINESTVINVQKELLKLVQIEINIAKNGKRQIKN